MNQAEIKIILLTLRVALTGTLCTLPLAIATGWFLARSKSKLKPVIEAFVSFPLVAPPVVTGYLLLLLLGKNSFVGKWLFTQFKIQLVFNFIALVIASVIVSFPLAVRSIRSAFELIDPAYENASLTLGASKIDTFFRVSIPMALPGIISGMVLTFARSLGEFGATITLAGNIPGKTQTIALMIYSKMQIPGCELQIFRLILISVILSFAAIGISEIINNKGAYHKK